jgi:hypothetical protein
MREENDEAIVRVGAVIARFRRNGMLSVQGMRGHLGEIASHSLLTMSTSQQPLPCLITSSLADTSGEAIVVATPLPQLQRSNAFHERFPSTWTPEAMSFLAMRRRKSVH